MTPASSTPPMQASTLFLKSMSSRLAARVPGPGAGARQRNAHEQQQRPEETASGFCLQLFAGLFAFFQTPGEKLADDFLVAAPDQHLSGEEIDDGHRQHIADDGDDKGQPQRQIKGHAVRNGAPQLNERHHGHAKYDQDNVSA